MTLILALGNADQFIQISDRRLSVTGGDPDDEWNKATGLTCADARGIFGFTGLATNGHFHTQQWFLDTLYECGPPEYTIGEILERLEQRATQTFRQNPDIARLPPDKKRLSILFSGYLDRYDPPLSVSAILTNFQDFETGQDSANARDHFQVTYWMERRPWEREYSFIQIIGARSAATKGDMGILRTMLEEHKPAKAIIGKAVELVCAMADRPRSGGTIGKQISSICLPRDHRVPPEAGYHTEVVSYRLPWPSHMHAVSDEDRFI